MCNWTEFTGIYWNCFSIIYCKCIKGGLMTNRQLKLICTSFLRCLFSCPWFPVLLMETLLIRFWLLWNGLSGNFLPLPFSFPLMSFSWHRVLTDTPPPPTKLSAKCDLFSIDPCTSIFHITAQTGRVTYISYLIYPYFPWKLFIYLFASDCPVWFCFWLFHYQSSRVETWTGIKAWM